MLHLGGTKVLGLLVTVDSKQGLRAMRTVQPRLAIPIHYDDYDLFKSPLSHCQREVEAAGLQDRVRYLSLAPCHIARQLANGRTRSFRSGQSMGGRPVTCCTIAFSGG